MSQQVAAEVVGYKVQNGREKKEMHSRQVRYRRLLLQQVV